MPLNLPSFAKSAIGAVSLGLLMGLPLVAGAQVIHHDSNTLHKIGRAITYPTRKDSANISTVTHRAINKNSVTNKKYGPVLRQKTAVTPGGHLKPVAPVKATGHG